MTTHTVNVSDIAPSTTEQQLHDFFTFCGKIEKIEFNDNATPKSAVVHFGKPSAAKTALMLNGGTLDGAHLSVTSETVHQDEEETHHEPGDNIEQSDKPRAGIAAEYLARGYTLSDSVLQRAIQLDNEKGISKRFLDYFQKLDTSLGAKALGPDQTLSGKFQSTLQGAHQSARSVDEQKGYSKSASDYYAKALASPLGQRVRQFYTTTSKQILDIHEEARRLADQHKAASAQAPSAPTDSKPAAPADVEPGSEPGSKQEAPTVV